MCARTQTHTHTHTHTYTHTHTHTHIHTHTHTHTQTHKHKHMHTCTHTRTHLHVDMHIDTHIRAHYKRTHACVHARPCPPTLPPLLSLHAGSLVLPAPASLVYEILGDHSATARVFRNVVDCQRSEDGKVLTQVCLCAHVSVFELVLVPQ